MIDLEEIENVSNFLWSRKSDGKSFEAAHILADALKEIAKSQAEIQKDLAWIKRKLNNEI